MGGLKNYISWDLNISDFYRTADLTGQLRFLIGFATLAPSTHNSQPWRFSIVGNRVVVKPDFTKSLSVGDRDNSFLFLSLGCALENLLVAARYYGFSAQVNYPHADNQTIDVVFDQEINSGANKESEDLIFFISKRVTNRHKFSDQLPDASVLDLISGLGTEELRVDILTPGEKHDRVKSLINITTPALLNQPDFRRELAGYVRTNITRSEFGMPAFVMGVPTIPSLVVPTILKCISPEKFNKKKQEGATNTKVFIVISTKNNNQIDWVKTGQVFQRINLIATKFGLSTHPMAAPLHDANARQELTQILDTNFTPQFLFRLGYSTKIARHSPRIPVDKCLL